MADTEKIIRKKYDVPIWHKSNLTIDEAVEYSGIRCSRRYRVQCRGVGHAAYGY